MCPDLSPRISSKTQYMIASSKSYSWALASPEESLGYIPEGKKSEQKRYLASYHDST